MNEITKAEIRSKLGNISLLRELLLGEQIEAYNYQLEEYRLKIESLEAKLQESQQAIEKRMTQLEENLLDRIELVAQDLENSNRYHSLKIQTEQNTVQQKIEALSQYSHENIDLLHQNLNQKTGSLKIEIAQSKLDLDRDLALFKQELLTKLDNSLAELTTNKISRGDLAGILFELSLNLQEQGQETDTNSQQDSAESFEDHSGAETEESSSMD